MDIFEKHHIIPKSLGGKDNKTNIVKVSPKEHFILHKLLVKCVEEEYFQKMSSALFMMHLSNKKQTGRNYQKEILKARKILKFDQNWQKGEKNSNYGLKWLKFDELKIQMKINKLETFNYIEQGWVYGRNMKYKNITKERNQNIKNKKRQEKIKKIQENSKELHEKIYQEWCDSGLTFSKFCKINNYSRVNLGTRLRKKYNKTISTHSSVG